MPGWRTTLSEFLKKPVDLKPTGKTITVQVIDYKKTDPTPEQIEELVRFVEEARKKGAL